MRAAFDARIASPEVLGFIRECQARARCALAGGVALSGAYLGHRLSKDIDLFVNERSALRRLVDALPEAAHAVGGTITLVQDAGTFVRAELQLPSQRIDVDLAVDATPTLAPPQRLDGVEVISLEDLRASKLTCLLSRSEPRDLVDVLFLERAGFPPDADLELALMKDAGMDPGVMGWLLDQFPVAPLPVMLSPLTSQELKTYRDGLSERMRQLARKP
ncbi:MAG: nucleotidyl transferase AbiEii/AbiGii toxin family protein [Archangium sp.]|nr:nucleotidyl transferase AbiEii/AbiGii toxin family protein [Archangium sp.]MDP3156804.1 nucleotidyl transferase AbiEii/AbiGii toxin family protein [Archangium sp.]MDP3569652.1 nucleotidyl transferase AbiEii/AbiGii toxin family protein [Archangium sp.]